MNKFKSAEKNGSMLMQFTNLPGYDFRTNINRSASV